MANLFKEMAATDPSASHIFRNEAALTPEYLPDGIVHRQNYINEIVYALKNLPKGSRAENLILVGPPGTGKTTCARFVIKQLSDYTQKVVPVYINCWEYSTRFAVLNLIATRLGEILPRRGIAADEIVDRIAQICRSEKKTPVVVLDEADRLFVSKYKEEKILYDIARSGEIFGVNFGLVAITNDVDLLALADQRIRSSIQLRTIVFEKYTPIQLKDILGQRAKEAFAPGALGEEVIPVCAAIGAKNNGDARVAITMLWKAALAAERKGEKKVQVGHVKEVSKEVLAEIRDRDIEMLGEKEKAVISGVKASNGRIESGRLYEVLSKKGIDERTARNYIEKLIAGGFLETGEVQKKHGRTREIKLAE